MTEIWGRDQVPLAVAAVTKFRFRVVHPRRVCLGLRADSASGVADSAQTLPRLRLRLRLASQSPRRILRRILPHEADSARSPSGLCKGAVTASDSAHGQAGLHAGGYCRQYPPRSPPGGAESEADVYLRIAAQVVHIRVTTIRTRGVST